MVDQERTAIAHRSSGKAKTGGGVMVANGWELEAELWLEQKAGTLPWAQLVKSFRRRCATQGWRDRSEEAIRVKLRRLNLSRKCTEDNFPRNELARLLGISPYRVKRWTIDKGLPYRKISRSQGAIAVSDFKRWLSQHPEELCGLDPMGLKTIWGEDAPTLPPQPSWRGLPRPVICLDTHEVFDSASAAANAKYVSRYTIPSAIARGGTAAGLRWQWLDQLAG